MVVVEGVEEVVEEVVEVAEEEEQRRQEQEQEQQEAEEMRNFSAQNHPPSAGIVKTLTDSSQTFKDTCP